ncbi:hypothetical protein MTR_4g118680 [Medicago truncatula]|uniref:Uncharacterized protein n=1 Tax=Medicago truncatula TaxID=3880 RepID=G7JJ18_MEDTR|nr:hypothetical protein MTR_4g118680 [Medicago truncatula]
MYPTCKSSFLFGTPELNKHYEMLVKSMNQSWSPKLETILENKIRLIKEKEKEKRHKHKLCQLDRVHICV